MRVVTSLAQCFEQVSNKFENVLDQRLTHFLKNANNSDKNGKENSDSEKMTVL